MNILKFLTVRKNKRIFTFCMSFLILCSSFIAIPQTVYASSSTLNIADYSTWEQVTATYGTNVSAWLKGIADNLGMSCSAFCTAVGSGALALSPYIIATLAVGSSAYLGYDIYTNYDTISDQLMTALIGGSAYADNWFQEYAQGILNGTHDLSKGIEVPIDLFNSMTMSLSNTLTYDLSETFENKNTCIRSTTSKLTSTEVASWLTTLGYKGTYTSASTIYNPIICMYNQTAQDYIIFTSSGYYNTAYSDLLLCEVAGSLYAQTQNTSMVDSMGYALQPIANSGVGWSSYSLSARGTVGLTAKFDLAKLTINNGVMTYLYNGATYSLSFLCPSTSNIVLGNITYSELAFPLTYWLTKTSMITVLPWYWQVSGISVEDMSTLDTKINTKATDIPSDYIDAIDGAIAQKVNIPISLPIDKVADWVNNPTITDTTAITDSIADTVTDPVINTDTGTSGILNGIKSLIDKIIELLQKILSGILSIPSILSDIWGYIQTIPQTLVNEINAMLIALFVPSEAVIEKMQNMVNEKIPFINQVYSWVDELMEIMQNPEDYASNLTFSVDMSKADSTYWDYGSSSTSALSATWYIKYKNSVDDIIVGIAWLIFLWNAHCMLPSIISAVSTTTFATANLEYQKYNVNTRTKKMNEAQNKENTKGGENND